MEVPKVGPITVSATLAKVPDITVFRTARDFTAWIGLTGRDRAAPAASTGPGRSPSKAIACCERC
jgi:transposase